MLCCNVSTQKEQFLLKYLKIHLDRFKNNFVGLIRRIPQDTQNLDVQIFCSIAYHAWVSCIIILMVQQNYQSYF